MIKHALSIVMLLFLLACTAPPERNCTDFKTGNFSFTTSVNGREMQTTFTRTATIEVDDFEEKKDTSSIRWINDCEYILKNINPKSMAEEKSIHIKILTTSDSSYTFEYNAIGDKRKFKGTAFKIN
ncbi:MAG: DNA topoisomerase IV [Flavobacteriaceae bacterium]